MEKKRRVKIIANIIEVTESEIRKQCKHNWIKDYIDDKDGEQSNMIIYCEHWYFIKRIN